MSGKNAHNEKYDTVDNIDEYMRGVIAANMIRRLPFNGN